MNPDRRPDDTRLEDRSEPWPRDPGVAARPADTHPAARADAWPRDPGADSWLGGTTA
ncbi:MAG: hypothetical protein HOW97_07030, partial [Catenulispora sp.]|nr:hypothetical protein [Catenulispora sp.]